MFCSISAFMAKLKMSLRIAVCLFQECVCNAVVTDPLFFKVCIPNDGHVEQVRPRCLQFILLHCLHYLPVNCSVVQLPSLQRESVAASSPNRRQRSRILCVWPHAGRTAIHSLLLAVSNSQIHSLPSSSSSKHPNSPLIVRCLLQRFPQFCKARGHCRCIDESPRVTESISAKKNSFFFAANAPFAYPLTVLNLYASIASCCRTRGRITSSLAFTASSAHLYTERRSIDKFVEDLAAAFWNVNQLLDSPLLQ